ncbi:MAG: response regulator [Treponema sp.]|nr:response regulator [Treponema sp.]
MITVVICDDEKLIRAGIKKILSENIQIPLNIIEAKNGAEALELCKTQSPDVLVTDIRMPVMDGVELMKQVSALEEKPGIIVLSGFDDFAYAKAAIQSGALSYILKPVDKKELVAAVTDAIEISRKEEQERNEETLKAIANEGRIDSESGFDTEAFQNGYYCISVSGHNSLGILEEILKPVKYYILEKKKDFATLVLPKEALFLVTEDMESVPGYIGVSGIEKSLSNLKAARRQAFCAWLKCFFSGNEGKKEKVFHYKSVESDLLKLDQEYEKMASRLEISDPEEIQKGLEKLFSFTAKEKDSDKIAEKLNYLYSKIISDLFTRYATFSEKDLYLNMKSIMIENIWSLKDFDEWLVFVRDYCIYLSALLSRGIVEHPFVEEALEYVAKNFTKNINMAIVANQVSVNYTWFSEKFKEHTGVNFNEYLKNLRIEEAKRLLEKDCYKVYEVAERSGFGDVKYFMKTFREATGKTPTEWKKTRV